MRKATKAAPKADPVWVATRPKILDFYQQHFPDKVEKITAFLDKNAGKEKKVVEGLLKQYAEQAKDFFADEAKILEEESGI